MRRFAFLIVIALITTAAYRDLPSYDNPPPDAHRFFNRSGGCTTCHDINPKTKEIYDHLFIIDLCDSCWKCHPPESLGRSHPIKVNAGRMMDADELPLDEDDLITCGTCHNPHGDGYSTTPLISIQEPSFTVISGKKEIPYYKNYYLRLTKKGDGFTPLCHICHENY